MPTKRSPSDSSSVRSAGSLVKRLRSSSFSSEPPSHSDCIKIHIVQAKLDAQDISELMTLVETHDNETKDGIDAKQLNLELCSDAGQADIVITAVRMKKRLERHLDWNMVRQKAIVTPEWLRDSIRQCRPLPCGDYAALTELHSETAKNCPDCENHTSVGSHSPPPQARTAPTVTAKTNLKYNSRYACARASPLFCINQALVSQFSVLRHSRELEGLDINALGYERAISVLKAYPHAITSHNFHTEVAKLPHLGKKMLSKIEEFLDTGAIPESQTILASSRYQSLSAFTMIYGVGPTTARKLYDIGLRSFEDMERYYDVPSGSTTLAQLASPVKRILASKKSSLPDISVKVGLALRDELSTTIPREEVEEIHAVVMKELGKIQPGYLSTIVGGYRRGKSQSNDIDIVISHPDPKSGSEQVKDICANLVNRLYNLGLVTHVMHLSGFHAYNALRTSNWDSLEKALTVFLLPPSPDKPKRIHRRLDLIFAAPEAYWTAVLGWTGSKMFERDLRLWAKAEKGMKFDSSGLTRRHDSKLYSPKSEQDIFDILGLEWIDPMLRNADA